MAPLPLGGKQEDTFYIMVSFGRLRMTNGLSLYVLRQAQDDSRVSFDELTMDIHYGSKPLTTAYKQGPRCLFFLFFLRKFNHRIAEFFFWVQSFFEA